MYPSSYQASREQFRALIDRVRERWPGARFISHAPYGDDHTIDGITADALESPVQGLIITTGEHGIEGYLGAAFLQWFADEFLPRLDPRRTGLLLVHLINPWGMAQRRRVNRSNVDLNRNFLAAGDSFASDSNADYARLQALLNPAGPIVSTARSSARLASHLLPRLIRPGAARIQAAFTLGQYRFPRGVYYDGAAPQPETQFMIEMNQRAAQKHYYLLCATVLLFTVLSRSRQLKKELGACGERRCHNGNRSGADRKPRRFRKFGQ